MTEQKPKSGRQIAVLIDSESVGVHRLSHCLINLRRKVSALQQWLPGRKGFKAGICVAGIGLGFSQGHFALCRDFNRFAPPKVFNIKLWGKSHIKPDCLRFRKCWYIMRNKL
jgi:hypothetical protein